MALFCAVMASTMTFLNAAPLAKPVIKSSKIARTSIRSLRYTQPSILIMILALAKFRLGLSKSLLCNRVRSCLHRAILIRSITQDCLPVSRRCATARASGSKQPI